MADSSGRRARRGRDGARVSRAKAATQAVTSYIRQQIPLTELLSEEGLAIIEANAQWKGDALKVPAAAARRSAAGAFMAERKAAFPDNKF